MFFSMGTMIKTRCYMQFLSIFILIGSFRLAYAVTTITDSNFASAISTCLSTNPVDGLCSSSEYGNMPD